LNPGTKRQDLDNLNYSPDKDTIGSGIIRLWGNFSVRVFVCMFTVMISLVILQNLFFIQLRQNAVRDLMISQSRVLTSLLAENVRLGVFSENSELLEEPVGAILKQDHVLEVLILDRGGKILYSACRESERVELDCGTLTKGVWTEVASGIDNSREVVHLARKLHMVFGVPVVSTGRNGASLYFAEGESDPDKKEILGFTAVAFDTRMYETGRQHALAEGIGTTVLFFFLVMGATWLIVRTATRPLRSLVEVVRSSDVLIESPDEIGVLRESFSSMIAQLSDSFAVINRLKNELEDLTRELIRTQEEERNNLAFDLHDNIAQELSSLKIYCGNIKNNWPAVPESVAADIEQMNRFLAKCINSVRDLSYELRPPGLRQLGLAATVGQLCDDFAEASGVEVNLVTTGLEGFEPNHDVAINCYRIIQEALNNIKKHARAASVDIKLLKSYPDLILRIRDNGTGFDMEARAVEALAEKRMGLKNMKKRATLVGGTLEIESAEGKGTKIAVKLPCGENSNA
jgi:signal transduction histidine kinase